MNGVMLRLTALWQMLVNAVLVNKPSQQHSASPVAESKKPYLKAKPKVTMGTSGNSPKFLGFSCAFPKTIPVSSDGLEKLSLYRVKLPSINLVFVGLSSTAVSRFYCRFSFPRTYSLWAYECISVPPLHWFLRLRPQYKFSVYLKHLVRRALVGLHLSVLYSMVNMRNSWRLKSLKAHLIFHRERQPNRSCSFWRGQIDQSVENLSSSLVGCLLPTETF